MFNVDFKHVSAVNSLSEWAPCRVSIRVLVMTQARVGANILAHNRTK